MINYDEIHRKSLSWEVNEREEAAHELAGISDKVQAWNDLHRLTQDNDYVRRHAADAIGACYSYIPEDLKKQAWDELHRLTKDKNDDMRWGAARAVGACYSHLPEEFKTQAWNDLHRLTQDKDDYVRRHAADAVGACYPHLPEEFKKYAWDELHRLMQDKKDYVRWRAVDAVFTCYSYIPEEFKKQAWDELIKLMQDKDDDVGWRTVDVVFACYPFISKEFRKQAWDNLHRLTKDKNDYLRRRAADAVGACYSHLPEEHKTQAWNDLHRLTSDLGSFVSVAANHSSGRVSIYRASAAEKEDDFRKEMENALGFFEKAATKAFYRDNPSKFCLPFYRSFYTLTFKKEKDYAEVQRYLSEARSAVAGSNSKEKLLEAVENLGNALKEVQKARDFSDVKADLNAYRRYCDRACELLDTTEDKAPGASRLIRKGLPIIDERIKGIIAEIEEKAKALYRNTRDTPFENLGKDVNRAGQCLAQIRDPISLEKRVQNMQTALSAICARMPVEERGDACELLRKANDEQYVEDKLELINMVLSKIPSQIGNGTNIQISNSNNVQITTANGTTQKMSSEILEEKTIK